MSAKAQDIQQGGQTPAEQKLTFRRFQEGDHKWGSFSEDIFSADRSHKCPTYVHRTPPVSGELSVGRGYSRLAADRARH